MTWFLLSMASLRHPAVPRHRADQGDPVAEDLGHDRLAVLWSELEMVAGQVQDVAVIAKALVDLLLQLGPTVPRLGGDHDEVDVAVRVGIAASNRSERDDGFDASHGLLHDARQHLDRAGQCTQRGDGCMAFVDAVHAGTPDGLRRDQPQPSEVSQCLLDGTQAVPIRDQRVHAPSGQGRASAKQHGERRTARSRHQAAEGFTEIHMNRILIMWTEF
jgi:hypothetical protein